MLDLISRKELMRLAANHISKTVDINDIARFPGVADTNAVIRCRECEHHHWQQEPCHGKVVHSCDLPHMRDVEVFNEFFCYYGKRRDDSE